MAQYYEPRKPLDIRGIVMSPYGLMIGFSVFIMVVMPMMKVGAGRADVSPHARVRGAELRLAVVPCGSCGT
jgi:hypothetical protein